MQIEQFVTEALGDASYLVVSGTEAVVIDPQRDVRPYVEAAQRAGARITHVLETHVHNDYISGGPELAALGATIVAPEGAGLEFPHLAVSDGDEIPVGTARIRALSAPGHTHHHMAYLAIEESGSITAAFTGGSIIIGGAGRTDLLGPSETAELTRLQWASARRLQEVLGDDAELLPTHGGGSFCSVGSGGNERRALLAVERERNYALSSAEFESFRAVHLANPGPIPAYYHHMAPINIRGAEVFGTPPSAPMLALDAFERERGAGAFVIDLRDRFTYAAGHVPASLSIEEGPTTLAYVSWVTPFNSALLLVSEDHAQAQRVTVDLFRIGYEQVRGFLLARTWLEKREAATLRTVDRAKARELYAGGATAYDVRFDSDRRDLPLPGALPRGIDRALEWAPDAEHDEPLVVCTSGLRATTVGSLLLAQGRDPLVLIRGGAQDLVRGD